MDIEKLWLETMNGVVASEDSETKAQQIEYIVDKLDWIGKVKREAEARYDNESGIDKDAWIKGYIVGFAVAAETLNQLVDEEEGEEAEGE
jgi:hypothetical protein